jgi:hypothetical protein
LFFRGNFLCTQSALLTAEIFRKLGNYPAAIFHLQEFYAWTRLAVTSKFVVIDTPLIQYRVRDDACNVSNGCGDRQNLNELLYCYEHFFENMDQATIAAMLPEKSRKYFRANSKLPLAVQINLLKMDHENPPVRIAGLHGLMESLKDSTIALHLRSEWKIDATEILHRIATSETGGSK